MQDAPLPTTINEHDSCVDETAGAGKAQPNESTVVPFSLRDLTSEEAVCQATPAIVAQLRFGTTELPADRLPLPAGEVIPLEESIAAPIELMVDGHVMARGELVSHNGRAGIRVTQVERSCRDQFFGREDAHAA
jgi:hypothetical protein